MATEIIFTHKGWFGLCPVYFAGIETEGPVVEPRNQFVEWLMTLSEYVFGTYFLIRATLNAYYEPEWPMVVTGEIEPIVKVAE